MHLSTVKGVGPVVRMGSEGRALRNTASVYDLATAAIRAGHGLAAEIEKRGLGETVDLARATFDLPVSHPDPAHLHLTLPAAWRERRLRVPAGIILHHRDVAQTERSWFGPVPATNVPRTLNDCARDGVSPETLRQAVGQALHRGLVNPRDLDAVAVALEAFGGLP